MENMPLASCQQMFFMHHGALAHFSLSVHRHLDVHYLRCWICRGGPIAWPPRSPNLNPLDFHLWGHLKCLVYSTSVHHEQTLHVRIMAACERVVLHLSVLIVFGSLCKDDQRPVFKQVEVTVNISSEHEQITPKL